MKKFLSIILSLLTVVSVLFVVPITDVVALTSSDVKNKLDSLISDYPADSYNPKSNCYYFVALLTDKIFGHGLPSQNTGDPNDLNQYCFNHNSAGFSNYMKVGQTLTVKDGTLTENNIKTLLSTAQPGDIIQMGYTKWNSNADNRQRSRHVMMVYSASSTGIVFYHAGSKVYFGAGSGSDKLNLGKTGKELKWSEFKYYFCDETDGFSLYRSKTVNTCSHSYGPTGICTKTNCGYQLPYDNGRDTSYAGTYKAKSGVTVYIRNGPYEKCEEVTHGTGGTFTVKASVLNSYNNLWYEISHNGTIYYVVAKKLEPVTHIHTYSIEYDSAHPHKQYKICSCGTKSYTGSTKTVSSCTTCYPQATYGSTNPDDYTIPERSLVYQSPTMKGEDVAWVQSVLYQLGYTIDVDGSYGKNSVANIKQFQSAYGLTVDGHCGPATRAKLSELWETKKHVHSYITYAEAAHPHNEYKKCSCGDIQYTGANNISWNESGYDSAHPHEDYRKCWCGLKEYLGNSQTVSTCDNCINESLLKKTVINNKTYELYVIDATWDKAKTFCLSKGGYLAEFEFGDSEDIQLRNFIGDKVAWIGQNYTYIYNGASVNSATPNAFVCEYDSYTITFDLKGGAGDFAPITKARDETVYLYDCGPSRDGYKFLGWNSDPNATVGAYWYESAYTANADVTLYAVWKKDALGEVYDYDNDLYYYSYKLDGVNTSRGISAVILYDQNRGSNTMTNEYGCEAAVDATGKVISNVYGVGCEVIPDGGFVLSAHISQDNVFVLKYVKVGDYVYFDSSSETVYVFSTKEKRDAFLSCRSGHSGESVIKNAKEPAALEEGYTGDTCCSKCNQLIALGESIPAILSDRTIEISESLEFTTNITSGGEKVYFKFTADKDGMYKMKFFGNQDIKVILYDTNLNKICENDNGGENDNFYIVEALSAGKSYIYEVGFNDLSMTGEFDILFDYCSYVLKYDANGGENEPESVTQNSMMFDISSQIPKREGYIFLGWAETPNAKDEKYLPGADVCLTANEEEGTLYAVWYYTGADIKNIDVSVNDESKTVYVAVDNALTKRLDSITAVFTDNGIETVKTYAVNGNQLLFSYTTENVDGQVNVKIIGLTKYGEDYCSNTVACDLKKFSGENGESFKTYLELSGGDANNDGKTDVKDLVRIKKILAEIEDYSDDADVSGNGNVTTGDLISLAKLIASGKNAAKAHAVTFVDEDGEVLETVYVPQGFGAKPSIIPEKDGYVFKGWDTKLSNITENKTIKAIFDVA